MKKTNYELVKEFHEVFDPQFETGPNYSRDRILLRSKLMLEELKEVFEEFSTEIYTVTEDKRGLGYSTDAFVGEKFLPKPGLRPINKAKVAKELADLLYVVYGSAYSMGIPIDEVFAEVHRSNMSKLGEDGKPIYREDGKVLKGKNFSPADIEKVLKQNE